MKNENNIIGCFISYPSLMYDATESQKENAKMQGDLFNSYIWGSKAIGEKMKKLCYNDYGQDLKLILFQFYVNPIPFELQNLKEIENYRKKEKAIGIPIVVTVENFFNKSEPERFEFIKISILRKLDLLAELVKKKKLDTNIESLKNDFKALWVDMVDR